jgi:dynein heavy chain
LLLFLGNDFLDEADEYEENFKRMKEESLRSRQAKMQEEYEEALREVEKWREKLGTKRKEVDFWMNKVDKSCIERIRAFQTPPVLIGQIMEMSKNICCFIQNIYLMKI